MYQDTITIHTFRRSSFFREINISVRNTDGGREYEAGGRQAFNLRSSSTLSSGPQLPSTGFGGAGHRALLHTHILKSTATAKTLSLQPNTHKLLEYEASRLQPPMLCFLAQLWVLRLSFKVLRSERLDEARSEGRKPFDRDGHKGKTRGYKGKNSGYRGIIF